ncbi:GumC family protein [Iningainema tapete]|uniref:non-specific protein-tyrosine kinase n=1 Tax=Iningainema tapete BLCC-T55 TaxID=2748662 RepID=A0A8J6XG09_9CYAN|nr:polysaccharide biosynthesis tyrosine autokinase [Iningainema tapete]MBD2773438.1 polysaccharide biosynthesis tyrosine autokinase [Iningainema tapete BLCC-T55]
MENKGNTEDINLQKYWLVLKRRWLVGSSVFVACSTLAGFSLFLEKPSYEASGKLLFLTNRTSSLTGVGEKIGHLESIKRESNPLDTQALIVQSEPVIQKVINNLELKDKNGAPLRPEAISIKAEALTGTDVLKVSFISTDAELAKSVVNQVMKVYIDKNILTNRSEAISAGEFVTTQLQPAKRQVDKAAEELRRFKTKNQVIDLQEETEGTVKTITSIDEELNNAKSQLADLGAQEIQITRQINLPTQNAVDITSLSQIPGVQEALAELQKVQNQLAAMRTRYSDAHPSVIDLQEKEAALNSILQQRTAQSLGSETQVAPGKLQIGKIKQDLTAEFVKLQSQRSGLEQKINTLSELRNAYKQRADILPTLEKKQGELERSLSVAQKSYENLLTRLQEIKVAENQTVGNARVLQDANVESNPAAMKKKLGISVGGVFAGLLLGVAAAFIVDLIDRRLKTAKEAEELFGHTLLGLIPQFETSDTSITDKNFEGSSPRIIVATSPRSVVHEAYQMLVANLKFTSLDKKVRTIVVTSSQAGEGKSEVSANLAAVMAQAGRRVLLVDADMRQPTQHHLWDRINAVGLSNVMVGQDEFSFAVQKVTSYLSVLTAGVMPPNPMALIDSERMSSLLDMLSQKYDYVIIDTPPLVGTPDAAVLGKMADGVLIVVRPSVLNSNSAVAAKSLLARSEANILGIVANGVDVKQEPESFFYYPSNRNDYSVEKVSNRTRTVSVGNTHKSERTRVEEE